MRWWPKADIDTPSPVHGDSVSESIGRNNETTITPSPAATVYNNQFQPNPDPMFNNIILRSLVWAPKVRDGQSVLVRMASNNDQRTDNQISMHTLYTHTVYGCCVRPSSRNRLLYFSIDCGQHPTCTPLHFFTVSIWQRCVLFHSFLLLLIGSKQLRCIVILFTYTAFEKSPSATWPNEWTAFFALFAD